MARNPKPLRRTTRRVMRALASLGPTSLCLPPRPQSEADRARLAIEDEMLMRILPPTKRNKRWPLAILPAEAGPGTTDQVLEDREAPRLNLPIAGSCCPRMRSG